MILNNTKTENLAGAELKKYRLKRQILHFLYEETSSSASDIGRKIGVSLPTAISLLNELKASNYVEVCGTGKSNGGRKPTLFGLSKTSGYVIACELGRYKCNLVIYNPQNQKVTPHEQFETNINDNRLVEKIFEHSQNLIIKSQIDPQKIFAVGLAMPGLVNEKTGMNYTVKNKKYRNIKERLEEKFKIISYVNNDARMQAYGEFVFGKAKGLKNAIIVNWNWGLGMGMILDGKLYNGAAGFAGEFSHIKMVEDGDLCICGKRGCLETVASVNVLICHAVEAVKEGRVSQLATRFEGKENEIAAEDIIQAARAGDEFSIALLGSVGKAVGKALANAIQLFNPEIIVLGGVVSGAKQYILNPIQQSIQMHCLEQISGDVRLVTSETWEQTGLLGTTAMLFQKLYSNMYN